MEDITEIPQSLLWALCDRALFASAFQAAIEFELIVLEWAFSKGYARVISKNKRSGNVYPSFSKALCYLKKECHIPEHLVTQIEKAWDTRNDLMHDFAWKSFLLGPEQSKDCLYEADKILRTAWFAIHDERCHSSF